MTVPRWIAWPAIIIFVIPIIVGVAMRVSRSGEAVGQNGWSAACSLRTYYNAQNVFIEKAHYGPEVGNVFANPLNGKGFPDLWRLGGPDSEGELLRLIDRVFAEASGPKRPRSGYCFIDITADNNGPFDYRTRHGLCAFPAKYMRTGRMTFIINHQGIVYFKDTAGEPLTTWPDVQADGWTALEE